MNESEIWANADAELLEELAQEARLEGESIDEYVERACREKARQA